VAKGPFPAVAGNGFGGHFFGFRRFDCHENKSLTASLPYTQTIRRKQPAMTSLIDPKPKGMVTKSLSTNQDAEVSLKNAS